ncbi:MAG TPA: YceI family protein, partial [Bryobacteraceae bacterium]|nr:YceI family protein [Bryobacteraceae bacterium]
MKPCVSRIAFILAVASLVSLPVFAGTTTYKIDPRHSSAQFAVTHLMISTVRGEFHAVNGIVIVDDSDLAKSSVNVTIDASTVDTREPDRDKH